MKKAFVLVALSLTMLPSIAANQRLYITGYRIGDSAVSANDERIVATNNNNEVKYDWIAVTDNRLLLNAYFHVFVPAGQKVKKWFAYNSDPNDTDRPPTVTNQFAGATTEYVWSYNSSDITFHTTRMVVAGNFPRQKMASSTQTQLKYQPMSSRERATPGAGGQII